jgi:methyl-accepting chemotaxis protein
MKKLSSKLIFCFGLMLLVVCGTLGIIGYVSSSNSVMNEVNKSLEQLAAEGAQVVNAHVTSQFIIIETISANEKIKSPSVSLEEKMAQLSEDAKRAEYLRIGIADLNGNLTCSDNVTLNIKDTQYFTEALAGKTTVSDPIVSQVDGSVLLPYAAPIKNDDKITAVLVAYRDGYNLSKITDKIAFGQTGSAYMITKNGNTIAHKDRDLVKNMDNDFENVKTDTELTSLVALEKKMTAGEKGFGSYVYGGVVKHMGFAPVEGTPWSLAVTARDSEVMSGVYTLRNLFLILSFILLLIGLLSTIFVSRLITKPIIRLVGAADRLSSCDLTAEIDVTNNDEVGILAKSFKAMADNINRVMTQINSTSVQVALGARQVSDSSMALSQGATEQASSVQELTASLEEISSQTRLNAEKASEANTLAEAAKLNALEGNSQMNEMLKAMAEINDASSNISKIIKVIDEIAFQTNILALNAAVEAARAGQHGKGFAVVADEVRNLAARSANAAKETTDMIEGSIKKVEVGTKLANETASALNHIVEDITKVSSLVNDISVASNEQATGVDQINQGIIQVSQVVQTNSATSEESAAASEALSHQAQVLQELVGKFKLKAIEASNDKFDGISPELLNTLKSMVEQEKKPKELTDVSHKRDVDHKPMITINDKDFGKY